MSSPLVSKKKLKFPYKKEKSPFLGTIYRPVAKVQFWSQKGSYWLQVWLIVDTGADYTILPRFIAKDLKIDLKKDCKKISTIGIGGQEKVYFLPSIRIKLGPWEMKIPLGFLDKDEVPPLLGRYKFMEKLDVSFLKTRMVEFSL